MYRATEKERQVAGVVAQVLEQQDIGVSEPSRELASPATRFLHGQIGFSGPTVGDLEIVAPWDLGAALAATALGVKREDPKAGQYAQHSFMDFHSRACGQLLTSLYGTGVRFWLSPPRIDELDPAGWVQACQRLGGVSLQVENWPVLAFLEVE